jgi:tryptophanyl-tRNA synthetase
MITPLSWLLRVPTFKDKVKLQPQNVNYGLVGYPVLMTSDIVLYKAEVVPVGEDQLPHLELAREITRRFNNMFGDTFPEPTAKLTSFPLVVGLDGKEKMSKQLGNDIELALSDGETIALIKEAVTDPARRYRNDPGHPEVCNIFRLQKYFNPLQQDNIADQCRSAKIGCVECKMILAGEINTTLKPFRESRFELAAKPKYVTDVLADGAQRAQVIARKTIEEVKHKMGLF